MATQRLRSLVFVLALLAGACAPTSEPARQEGTQATSAARQVKSLTIAADREPDVILTALGSRTPSELRNALHQHLATYDNRGDVLPQLAVELPSFARGTWVVHPDGTMQTTYRIHPNVTWHDGTPLTARDFVFGLLVVKDPDLPIDSRDAAREISHIDTPDDHTLSIAWARSYAYAHAIVNDDVGPMPAHLLQSAYEAGSKEQFWRLPYWTREFVGVGPFKLVQWEAGSHVQMEAHDAFYAGRPRIDRLTVRFIPSVDTIVAHLLAGTVDTVGGGFVKIQQTVYVQREWERAGQKPTAIAGTGSFRIAWFQHRDPAIRELLDPRVRRGMLHALDRQSFVDALTEGKGQIADTFIPHDDVRWEWVQDVAVRYPYNVRRAEELFAEAGLRRGSDGVFANPAGARMVLSQWVNAGTENEQEVAIAADHWKAFGTPTEQMVLGRAQMDDRQYRVTFPALYHTSVPRLVEIPETRFGSANCPGEANRFTGQNYGCYRSPVADQILGDLKAAIDPEQQRPLYRDLIRLHTEDLAMLPLYFQAELTIARAGVTGVKGYARPYGGTTWNIGEWSIG